MPALTKAYNSPLSISKEKYNDLMRLCNNKVIPEEFHAWYLALPYSESVKNCNPEPAAESGSEEEEEAS